MSLRVARCLGRAFSRGWTGRRSPRIPLFDSGDPALAERLDELLEGLGER